MHGDVTAANILVDDDLRPVTLLTSRLGYDPQQLLLYRCVHSLLVANAHDQDPYGRDSGVPLTASLFASAPLVSLLG